MTHLLCQQDFNQKHLLESPQCSGWFCPFPEHEIIFLSFLVDLFAITTALCGKKSPGLYFLSMKKCWCPKWGKSVWKTCFSSSTFEVDIHFFMRSNEVKYLYCAEVFARVLPIWQSKQEINLMAWLTSDFVEKKLKSLTLFQEFQPITHHKSLENAWYARKQFDAWTEFSQSAVKHFCQTLSPWKSQCVIGIEQIFFGSCISWIY